jgi:hypothetical protein
MVNQVAERTRGIAARSSPCGQLDHNDLEAAFVYAVCADDSDRTRRELGYVDLRGDIYDNGDHTVCD